MTFDVERIRRFAPAAVAIVIVAAGWLLLVSPAMSRSSRSAREVSTLRQQLTQLRSSVSGPAPQPAAGDPVNAFERAVAAGDASSAVLEQLAGLAAAAHASNLLIETGERVVIGGSTGPTASPAPQAGSGAQPDPRFALFNTPLTYSPVSMSFDAEFGSVGTLLWKMRDMPTTIEIRIVDIKPLAADVRKVHVMLSLFAYARPRSTAGAGAQP
jgi:hypothetical protein